MNREEVKVILAAASAIDPTMPAPDANVLSVWTRFLKSVPAAAGEPAVQDYYKSDAYREHRRAITPGDIYGYYKRVTVDYNERKALREVADQRAAIEAGPRQWASPGRTSIHELFARMCAERRGEDPEQAEAEAAAARLFAKVQCPWKPCRAQVGQPCTGYGGKPLRHQPAHDARIEAALKAQQSA